MAIESFGSISPSQYTSNLGQVNQSLASGSRINNTADDPAGQAVVTELSKQIKAQDVAVQNANNGIGVIQTADGATQQITEQVQRLSELSLQASNGTYSDAQRAILNQEFQQGLESIGQIAETTSFNGINLLNGDSANLSIALNQGSAEITLPNFSLGNLGLNGLDITNAGNATNALDTLSTALGNITDSQAQFGAQQNRLTTAIDNITNQNLNSLASRSQINDTDFARAIAEQTRLQILNESSLAMQAQGNQSMRNILPLLSA